MSNRLKAGVIGVGKLGAFHAEKYCILSQELPLNLIGIYDIHFERSLEVQKYIKEKFNIEIKVFAQYQDLLTHVDVVTIATPSSTHEHWVELCLRQKKHILVEKPLALTFEKAKELTKLAKSLGLVLSVGHSERWNPVFHQLKSITKTWKLQTIEFMRHSPFAHRVTDVSVVDDLMIHDLDLFWAWFQTSITLKYRYLTAIQSSFPDWSLAVFLEEKKSNQDPCIAFSASRVNPQMTRIIRGIFNEGSVLGDLQNSTLQVKIWESNVNSNQKGHFHIDSFNFSKQDHLLLETREFVTYILNQSKKNLVILGEDVLEPLKWRDLILGHIHG